MDEGARKLDYSRAPAFEVFFQLGKKTMRPGGLELTCRMLEELRIDRKDDVVELAPGRGATTRMVMKLCPHSYTAVERDQVSQESVQGILRDGGLGECVVGTAQATGLEEGCASVVFGEAMLTMQTETTKRKIAEEAIRLLAPGGRYAIHEICLKDNLSVEFQKEIEGALQSALRVGARPLTLKEWQRVLEEVGFTVRASHEVPMLLLAPPRVVRDEGLWGALRFAFRVMASPAARRRILEIRRTLKRYSDSLGAVTLIAVKPAGLSA